MFGRQADSTSSLQIGNMGHVISGYERSTFKLDLLSTMLPPVEVPLDYQRDVLEAIRIIHL